jgi:hypothetical protein
LPREPLSFEIAAPETRVPQIFSGHIPQSLTGLLSEYQIGYPFLPFSAFFRNVIFSIFCGGEWTSSFPSLGSFFLSFFLFFSGGLVYAATALNNFSPLFVVLLVNSDENLFRLSRAGERLC